MSQSGVADFYDGPGWKLENGLTYDAIINENLNIVASDYVQKVRNRIAENLGSGDKLLDVGCGPIQYPEYINYSKKFKKRVCVDLSQPALDLARSKIGNHGEFIKGDYLEIETPEFAPFDGATLINVLYHVKKENQADLVRKILADLKVGSNLVIVYSNPQTLSAQLTKTVVKILHFVKKSVLGKSKIELQNPIYFFRFPNYFWNQFEDVATVKRKAWRTFSPQLEKVIFKKYLGGKALLRVLFRLEKLGIWKNLSEYTLIILEKK
jgi:SAM-dependent methyltransferase